MGLCLNGLAHNTEGTIAEQRLLCMEAAALTGLSMPYWYIVDAHHLGLCLDVVPWVQVR